MKDTILIWLRIILTALVLQKRVYCQSNCGTNPNDDSDDPANAVYVESPEAQWLVINGSAIYDEGTAEMNLANIATGTPGFYATFPGGFIPKGTQIFAYSASENDANTQTSSCRILGAPATVLCPFTSPLPVGLLDFKATLELETVRLDWKTVTEKEFREFIIERSANGRDFSAIGAKAGKGNSKEPNSYVHYDYAPLDGTSYYRLKMVNEDGTFMYSPIETVTLEVKYTVYPIPADDKIIVSVMGENKKTRSLGIKIYNILGSFLLTGSYTIVAGENDIKVPTSQLQPGVYILEINDGESIIKKRIVINR